MVTVTLQCQYCASINLTRNGLAADGRQRYLCRDCQKRSREQPRTNAYSKEEREQILRAYDERSSLRGLTRTFGVSRNTVTDWLEKGEAIIRA
jgi:transposase-like protein